MLSKVQKYIDSLSSTPHLEALQEACQLFEEEREQWKKERLKLLERLEIAVSYTHLTLPTKRIILTHYLRKCNYLGFFRSPIDLSTGFAWHKVQKGHYALESSKVYSFHFIDSPPRGSSRSLSTL